MTATDRATPLLSVVLERPGEVVVREEAAADLPGGRTVVRPLVNGICGSDLAAFRGTAPQVTYPRVLGHELVVEVLQSPERPELVGRRAVVEPIMPCGACRSCRIGRPNSCTRLRVIGVQADGGLTSLFPVDAARVYPIPEGLSERDAVLAEPTSVAYHAVQRSKVEAGQVAVVFGAGTIGLLITQILQRGRGCRVLVVEMNPWRRAMAESFGALGAPTEWAELPEFVRAHTDGELADVVFEATGAPDCTLHTTDVVASAGTVVLVGWNPQAVPVDTITLMRKEVDLLGSRASTGIFPNVLRLLADGVIDTGTMVTHHFAIEESPRAFELLADPGAQALKIVIDIT